MIKKTDFDGYDLFTLSSGDLEVSVTDLGATVTKLRFHGRTLSLGYDTAAEYLAGRAYLGAIIGRFANRIGGGAFMLNGRRYELTKNENGNTLHSADAFNARRWQGEIVGDGVRFTLFSPDGDKGFPGDLTARVTYTVDGGTLRIDFEGDAAEDTVFAPTTHLYFNLDGTPDIRAHILQMDAAGVLEADKALIPTGRVLPADGAFDFSSPRPIGQDYDHCFVLKGETACRVSAGGVRLTLTTDFPALQLYTGAFLGDAIGANRGFAIEPEFYPDAPNRPEFPSALLRGGMHFHRYAKYSFEAL